MVASGGRAAFTPEALGVAMREINAIGYTGYEPNLACLPLGDPASFARLTSDAGEIELCAAHAAGRWWDESGTATVADVVRQAIQLRELGCRRLVVSVQKPPVDISDEQLDRLVSNLNRLGRACREAADVHVALHNHAPEVADDAKMVRAIVEHCPPEDISLGADLGWVAYGGFDVVEFIERFGDRLTYLHVRDVDEAEPDPGFVEVGRGVLNYAEIVRALVKGGYDGWVTAESDAGSAWHGHADPVRTARAQYDGLRSLLGSIG